MTTGIIYLAKNTISKKSYVGQTTRTLEQRKKEHLNGTIKNSNESKFARALRKYSQDNWEWSVLTEVNVTELDEYERFFIKDLNSFKNGYNSTLGGSFSGEGNPKFDNTIHTLWHPEHGEIKETITELYKRSSSFTHIQELLRENRQHIAGYVLLKNKDNYNKILKIHNFYHPNHGIITCTSQELFNKFPEYFLDTKECNIYELTRGKCKTYKGWCLAENKDKYEKFLEKSDLITLSHPEHGIKTLTRKEFKHKYGLTDSAMTYLKNGKYKTSLGWKFQNNES